MTKQGINKNSVATIRKHRNTKFNDSSLVVDWIIDRVGGMNMKMGGGAGEKKKEEKKKIVVCKKMRRHSF